MKAITYDAYTGPEGLSLTDQPTPKPGNGQVRVKVGAASLNAYDWHMYRGEPTVIRAQFGFRLKEPRTVGADVAGVVDAVGAGVTEFKEGDRVFGSIGRGACAEFAVAGVDALAALPAGASAEGAASAAMAGLTALQALRDTAKVQAGERVLIWGASGGVGHLAVQIAKALGAGEVDAVCSGANAAWLKESGADRAFDYTTGDLPGGEDRYDVIVDTVATASVHELGALLTPGGRVAAVGSVAQGGRALGPLGITVRRILASKFHRVDYRNMLARVTTADLAQLGAWLADGTIVPRVAKSYALAATADACRELEGGHVAGKLVITP